MSRWTWEFRHEGLTWVDHTEIRRNKDQPVVAETHKQSGAYSIVVPLEPSRNCPPMKIPVLNDVLPLYLGVFHSKLNVEGILERFQVARFKAGRTHCCSRALYTSKDHASLLIHPASLNFIGRATLTSQKFPSIHGGR